jgi:hypothetical protein
MFGTAAIFLLMGQGPTESEIVDMTRSVTMVCNTADALDALREAVKPLQQWAADFDKWASRCDRNPAPSRILPDMRPLLDVCTRLISETGEGNG